MSVAAVFNVTDFGTVWLLAACIALNTTSACGRFHISVTFNMDTMRQFCWSINNVF